MLEISSAAACDTAIIFAGPLAAAPAAGRSRGCGRSSPSGEPQYAAVVAAVAAAAAALVADDDGGSWGTKKASQAGEVVTAR